MKKVAPLALLALAVAFSSCGTRTPTTTVENTTAGSWEAQLVGGLGVASLLNFVTQFTVTNTNGSTEPLTVTSFGFINSQLQAGSCFPSGVLPPTGTLTITVLSTGQATGSLTYAVSGPAGPDQNTLSLSADPANGGGVSGMGNGTPPAIGNLTNGVAWGTWTLSGPCAGSSNVTGTFIMCQGTNKCTIP